MDTPKISMQFCASCQLYRLCISETRTWPLGSDTDHYCIEHRGDYGDWQYAITLRHGRLVIVAPGNTDTTIKATPATLQQARIQARQLARPGDTVIEMLPEDHRDPPSGGTPPSI